MTSLTSRAPLTRCALAAAAACGVAAVFAASPASATPTFAFSPHSPQGRALLASSAPKTVIGDARGRIIKVVPGVPPLAARHNEAAFQAWFTAQDHNQAHARP